MVTVIIKQEVVNFIEWKKVFDNNEDLRKQNQIETIGIYCSVTNPDIVTCIIQAPSIEVFKNHYFNNPKVINQVKASVKQKEPSIEYYNSITEL